MLRNLLFPLHDIRYRKVFLCFSICLYFLLVFFTNLCKKSNVSKKNIIFKEIYNDWYEKDGYLVTKNKKWVNNFINEEYRPLQKTDLENLFISGSHCKTSISIWSMESAVESGKICSNEVLKKYNKEKIKIYYPKTNPILCLLKYLDNILYNINLPNIIDVIIIIIVIYLIKKSMK